MIRILLVEDDVFIVEIYQKKFEVHGGFEVTSATTGKQALARLKEQEYDIVMLDMVIPEVSGMDVLRELRAHPETYRSNASRVVVFSNLSSPEDRAEAAKNGVRGFISKSEYSPTQVIAEVERYVRIFSEQAKNSDAVSDACAVGHPGAGKKILFIEDEDMFVDMFGKRLRTEGYDVVVEKDGQRGLETALSGSFDLILTDAMLPGLSGVEIAREIRKDPKRSKVPIFITTASLDDREIDELRAAEIVDRVFLKTKVTPTELAYVINGFFSLEPEADHKKGEPATP